MTSSTPRAYVITGPTSGIGYRTARELAAHGTLVLVGRSPEKLRAVVADIERDGGRAIPVTADLSDPADARRAAAEIVALGIDIAAVHNNAGMGFGAASSTPLGWDTVYATNHLGPFLFTESLIPHLADGTQILFTVSAVEDPERKPAVASGFRGGRFLSVEASARGEWRPGGSATAGFDAYATSKQGNLATALAFAREYPRLRINAVEPGFSPGSDLGRTAPAALRFISKYVLSPIAPFIRYWSTPTIAGRMIAKLLTTPSTDTGVYYDETGKPMRGSTEVMDPAFQDRVVAETRAFLAAAGV